MKGRAGSVAGSTQIPGAFASLAAVVAAERLAGGIMRKAWLAIAYSLGIMLFHQPEGAGIFARPRPRWGHPQDVISEPAATGLLWCNGLPVTLRWRAPRNPDFS